MAQTTKIYVLATKQNIKEIDKQAKGQTDRPSERQTDGHIHTNMV